MRARVGELKGSGMYLNIAEAGSKKELLRKRIETMAEPTGPCGAAKETDAMLVPWSKLTLRSAFCFEGLHQID